MSIIRIILFVQLFFSLPLFATDFSIDENFTLTGHVNGKAPKEMILSYLDNLGKGHQDTAEVREGKFEFKGMISGPTFAYLIGKVTSLSLDDPNRMIIFLEPTIMEVELDVDDFSSANVKGSITQNEFHRLNMTKRQLNLEQRVLKKTLDSVNREISSHGKSKELQDQLKNIESRWSNIYESLKAIEYNFVRTNVNSIVSAFLMPALINAKIIPLDSAEIISRGFPKSVRNSLIGKRLETTIKAKRAVVVGNQAPFLNGRDINGKIIRSEDYLGERYLLLDFWASWCAPCHEQAPYLNDFFDKYRKLGLEIISISADQDRSVWKKAITKDKIDRWRNMLISDDFIKENGKKVNDRFSVAAYPVILLIDKTGVIIYRADGYSGSDEMKKLENLISSSISRRP